MKKRYMTALDVANQRKVQRAGSAMLANAINSGASYSWVDFGALLESELTSIIDIEGLMAEEESVDAISEAYIGFRHDGEEEEDDGECDENSD